MRVNQFIKLVEKYFQQLNIWEKLSPDDPAIDEEGTVLADLQSEVERKLPYFTNPQCDICKYKTTCTNYTTPMVYRYCFDFDENSSLLSPMFDEVYKIWTPVDPIVPFARKFVHDKVIMPIRNSNFNKDTINSAKIELSSFYMVMDNKTREAEMVEKTIKILDKMLLV
jgi:hypothetical protein